MEEGAEGGGDCSASTRGETRNSVVMSDDKEDKHKERTLRRLPLLVGNHAPLSSNLSERSTATVKYVATSFDYSAPAQLHKWIDVFVRVQHSFTERAKEYEERKYSGRSQEDKTRADSMKINVEDQGAFSHIRAIRFDRDFRDCLEEIKRGERGGRAGAVDCVDLCRLREHCLRENGLYDIFDAIKEKENTRVLKYLDLLCERIAAEIAEGEDSERSGSRRWKMIIKGIFAGNIFDLGSDQTVRIYDEGGGCDDDDDGAAVVDSFLKVRNTLNQPFAINDMHEFIENAMKNKYTKALVFVDNAGSDIVFGMLPLIRELILYNVQVIICANELPSINDMTVPEMIHLLDEIEEPVLKEAWRSSQSCTYDTSAIPKLKVVSTGSDIPVIDLDKVSDETCNECLDADLIILEGMGRSIETNFNSVFCCDSLKVGMIKHKEVADCLGGKKHKSDAQTFSL